jgi:hypothetical protein
MFAAGTATEVAARDEHTRAPGFRAIQFEVGVVRAVVTKPPVEEQVLPEAGPLDPLEELLGDDLIGIDVGRSMGTTKPVWV